MRDPRSRHVRGHPFDGRARLTIRNRPKKYAKSRRHGARFTVRMLATALASTLFGLDGVLVRIEVEAARGVPSFELVGLAEAAVRESRVRVKAALAQVGVDISEHRITVNMAPADLKKSGSGFDLAIAVATLAALGKIPQEALLGTLFVGELS